MIILAVDDEAVGLEALESAVRKAEPEAEVFGFHSPGEALAFVRTGEVYAAFLDIFMAEMNGVELAKKIKLANPSVHIIFATGYDEYMGEAFAIHTNGYIMKPITPQKVRSELDNLKDIREVYAVKENPKKPVRFQCFGNFEAFYMDIPLRFKYDRSKEVLAYLVSRRGALCSNDEIISVIWEDDTAHDSYLRGIRKDLMDVFKECGVQSILTIQRGKMGIAVENVSCDYYDFLSGNITAINSYGGEFMNQYSWGERINGEMYFGKNKKQNR